MLKIYDLLFETMRSLVRKVYDYKGVKYTTVYFQLNGRIFSAKLSHSSRSGDRILSAKWSYSLSQDRMLCVWPIKLSANFLGLISFICCFWECANILNQQTISWFEMARNNNIRYSPGPCIYLGLLYSLIQITVALFKAVLDCKEKRYIEGDYV